MKKAASLRLGRFNAAEPGAPPPPAGSRQPAVDAQSRRRPRWRLMTGPTAFASSATDKSDYWEVAPVLKLKTSEVARNNYAGFDPGWEAGGAKFFLSRDLIVRDNYVHDNDGPGLWTDIDNVDVIYEGNVVVDNAYQGIHHEISFGAVIRRNVVERNGLAFDEWLWGAQILIQNSSGAEVYCNRVFVDATGGDGIALIQQDRGAGSRGPYRTRENLVHHKRRRLPREPR